MGKYKGKFESGASGNAEKYSAAPQKKQSSPKNAPVQNTMPPDLPVKKKKKMSTAAKIALITLLVIVILVGGVLVCANVMLNQIDRETITGDPSLSYADLLGDEETHDEADSTDAINSAQSSFDSIKDSALLESGSDIVNYLVIGSDRRGTSGFGNSDAMIIVSLNKSTQKIHLTSLMRAMYVCVPKDSGDTWGMLNWAYAWGGPDMLIQTVENNFKVQIDHYAAVDFSSFEKVIDSLGGVTLELSSGEASYVNEQCGSALTSGYQILNGEQALSYSRCRHLDNDFKRTHRQRNVIEAVIKSATSLNVSQLTELANVLFPAINTDMTNAEILGEAVNLVSYKNYAIDQMMLPIENQDGESYTGIMYKNGAEMYYVDLTTNLPALEEFIKS